MIKFSKNQLLITTLLIIALFTACNNKKNIDKFDYVEEFRGTSRFEMDDIGPPPNEINSKFESVKDWLTFIVDNEKPKKSIEIYNFDVFEGQDNYTICLTGVNTYNISEDFQKIKIEYEPLEKYFPLPNSDFKGLKREQVFENLTNQLNEFTKTNTFKNSFFSKAKSINTSWKRDFWLNK